jgi:carbonic anhydrase/acetyltransferase-like protein (isoleucine patch superfamily)
MSTANSGLHIDPSANIVNNAIVSGDVTIGPDVCVMYGAVVRGDCSGTISIGARCNIQDLVCVHVNENGTTILHDDVAVGHGAIIHGCEIESHTLIGMGSIVLDGAHIGKNCIIGAGALVAGGKVIPDGSVVMGVPGRIVREATDQDIAYIQGSLDEYVKIGRELRTKGECQEF